MFATFAGRSSPKSDSLELPRWENTEPETQIDWRSPYSLPTPPVAARVNSLREQLGTQHTLQTSANLAAHCSQTDAPSQPLVSCSDHTSNRPLSNERQVRTVVKPATKYDESRTSWLAESAPPPWTVRTRYPLDSKNPPQDSAFTSPQTQPPISDLGMTIEDFTDVPLEDGPLPARRGRIRRVCGPPICSMICCLILLGVVAAIVFVLVWSYTHANSNPRCEERPWGVLHMDTCL